MSHLGYGFVGWLILEITSGLKKKKTPSGPDPQMNRKRGEGLSLRGGKRGWALFWGGRLAQLWKGENLRK